MPAVEATEEAAPLSLGLFIFLPGLLWQTHQRTHRPHMQAPRRCPPSSILVWLYVDLHKSQYPLGFLNPKDLNSPGPVAVAHTGDL